MGMGRRFEKGVGTSTAAPSTSTATPAPAQKTPAVVEEFAGGWSEDLIYNNGFLTSLDGQIRIPSRAQMVNGRSARLRIAMHE